MVGDKILSVATYHATDKRGAVGKWKFFDWGAELLFG